MIRWLAGLWITLFWGASFLLYLAFVWIPDYAFGLNPYQILSEESSGRIFGTDYLNRYVLDRLIVGGGQSLYFVGLVFFLSIGIGGVCGASSGTAAWRRQKTSIGALMLDFLFLFLTILPFYPVLLLVFSQWEPASGLAAVVVAFFLTPLAYCQTAAFAREICAAPYIETLVACGKSKIFILLQNILPSIIARSRATAALLAIYAVQAEAAVGFLGLGLPDDYIGLGAQLDLRNMLADKPLAVILPAASIFLTLISLQILFDKKQFTNR